MIIHVASLVGRLFLIVGERDLYKYLGRLVCSAVGTVAQRQGGIMHLSEEGSSRRASERDWCSFVVHETEPLATIPSFLPIGYNRIAPFLFSSFRPFSMFAVAGAQGLSLRMRPLAGIIEQKIQDVIPRDTLPTLLYRHSTPLKRNITI